MREGEEVAAPGDCALRKIGEEQLSRARQSPTWNHLPPELHIHILSFLLPKVLRTTPRILPSPSTEIVRNFRSEPLHVSYRE